MVASCRIHCSQGGPGIHGQKVCRLLRPISLPRFPYQEPLGAESPGDPLIWGSELSVADSHLAPLQNPAARVSSPAARILPRWQRRPGEGRESRKPELIPDPFKGATSANAPLLRLQSSEGGFTTSPTNRACTGVPLQVQKLHIQSRKERIWRRLGIQSVLAILKRTISK